MHNECRGVTASVPLEGTSTSHPILLLSSQTASPLLQGLFLTRCGDDILHNAVVVSGAFRHQRAFLLMTIPRRSPCGGASVEKQETVEINLFLSRVFCGSSRVTMQGTTFALPLAWCDCRQVISPLWSNFMSLKV